MAPHYLLNYRKIRSNETRLRRYWAFRKLPRRAYRVDSKLKRAKRDGW